MDAQDKVFLITMATLFIAVIIVERYFSRFVRGSIATNLPAGKVNAAPNLLTYTNGPARDANNPTCRPSDDVILDVGYISAGEAADANG
jgi:hypothetical protein